MIVGKGNAGKMNEDLPQGGGHPHRTNTPVSNMGQQWDENHGMPVAQQDRVIHGSPMTAASLSLLGAGSPYRADTYGDIETNASTGGFLHG